VQYFCGHVTRSCLLLEVMPSHESTTCSRQRLAHQKRVPCLDTTNRHSAIVDLRYVVMQGNGFHAIVRHRLATILDMRGSHWLDSGNAGAALECFEEASQLDPLCSRFFVHRAIAHIKLCEWSIRVPKDCT